MDRRAEVERKNFTRITRDEKYSPLILYKKAYIVERNILLVISREMFVDPTTNEFRKPGSVIRPGALCETLRVIAEKNATEFYNGTIGRLLVDDLREQGGIITMQDLNEYR